MSGIYTRLAAGLMFPLHEQLKGHDSVRRRRELEDSQWWTADRLEALRVRKLREFLADIGSQGAALPRVVC